MTKFMHFSCSFIFLIIFSFLFCKFVVTLRFYVKKKNSRIKQIAQLLQLLSLKEGLPFLMDETSSANKNEVL